jgi:hypothetical protein
VAAGQLADAIVKEIEPLLETKGSASGPFYGGSERLTLVEVGGIFIAFYFISFHVVSYHTAR